MVELLTKMIEPIQKILSLADLDPIASSFSSGRILPLGKAKLRAIELLQAIVSLKKASIVTAVGESGVMKTVLALIERHPWNNMV